VVDGGGAAVRYGLEDESAKLNVNALLADADEATQSARLMALPGMTIETADAILDWLDADDAARTNGAESAYYLALTPSYAPRNGPIGGLDELLLVRGVTPELLYGVDVNRNGMVDVDETPRGEAFAAANADGSLNRGWSAYLTTYSAEALRSPLGEPLIDVNGGDLTTLHGDLLTALDAERANFIILSRQYGANRPAAATAAGGSGPPTSGGGSGPSAQPPAANQPTPQTVSASSVSVDLQRQGGSSLGSLLDLIGTQVTIPGENNAPTQVVPSPWPDNPTGYRELLELYDVVSAGAPPAIAGRINVNLAPRAVLATLPNIDAATVDQILLRRRVDVDPLDPLNLQRHAVWLLAEGIATLEQMRNWERYVTARGDVYRCQVVGFFDADPSPVRIEVVFERLASPAAVLDRRILKRLGAGFLPETLGVAANATPAL
jgi:hypothetical protein